MKIPAIALAFAAVLLVIIAATSIAPARAQNAPTAPANIQATDGAHPGAVTISWNAAADTAFYRIGWVASDNIATVQAAGRPWLDAFAFTDVTNYGQTDHTLTDLAPGVRYAFIIGSLNNRFGAAQWSEWAYLTLAEAPPTSCPIAPLTPMPTPTATPSPEATPTVAPTPTRTSTPTPAPTRTLRPTPTGTGDYDADKDGLIEISNLAQLNAIRTDLNGDGISPAPAYATAFPNAMPGMGCPYPGCTGYELVANLDFDTNGNGEADAGDAYWNDGAGWVPIGAFLHEFTADFDGNNYTIANLYINRNRAHNVGLFGRVSGNFSGSSIKQVRLASATVFGYTYVGILIGYSHNSAISGSYATGSVSIDYFSGRDSVGGLVGHCERCTISNSYAIGSVSGSAAVGGLVGYCGGCTISGSYATGSVSGNDFVGGLVGRKYHSRITASYAMGSVSGKGDDIGGLVGKNIGGSITASYAVGSVSTTGDTLYVGGLIGHDNDGTITLSYWDTEATSQVGSYGGVGKTTAELQSPTDATGIYAHWNPDHWDFGNSTQYPVLKHGGLDPASQHQQMEGSQ